MAGCAVAGWPIGACSTSSAAGVGVGTRADWPGCGSMACRGCMSGAGAGAVGGSSACKRTLHCQVAESGVREMSRPQRRAWGCGGAGVGSGRAASGTGAGAGSGIWLGLTSGPGAVVLGMLRAGLAGELVAGLGERALCDVLGAGAICVGGALGLRSWGCPAYQDSGAVRGPGLRGKGYGAGRGTRTGAVAGVE